MTATLLDTPTPPPIATHPELVAQARESLAISGSDIFALGHYPGNPIYPGVLIAERLCRLAQAVAAQVLGPSASVIAIKRIQYLNAVLPGDVLDLHASLKKSADGQLEISATASVGDRTMTRATLCCAATPRPVASIPTSQAGHTGAQALTHRQLAGLLPHRYPFLLLDTVEDHEPGQWLRGRKVVNRASPLFLDGLPPHYPQGLVIESVGQAGIALFFKSQASGAPLDIVLGSVSDTALLMDVPYDVALTIDVRIDRLLPNGVIFSGQARIGDQVVTRVGSLIAMVDPRHQPTTGLES